MKKDIKHLDALIIGGGIIGCSTARELSKYDLSIALLEANNHVAGETSEGNSGVIHVGFDAVPGTKKAKFNIQGRKLWFDKIFPDIKFSRAKVPSLVVALKTHKSSELSDLGSYEKIKFSSELDHLKLLYKRGIKNKLAPSEMKILSREETMKIEPNIAPSVMGSFYAPNSWAISGPEASYALMANAVMNGVDLHLGEKVIDIEFIPEKKLFWVKTTLGYYTASYIIDAAGHYADEIAALANVDDFKQTTRRGEYRILEKTESKYIRNIIFKTPTIFGKGVVVAPMLTGHVLVGPTAVDGVPKSETRLVSTEMFNKIGDIGHDMVPTLRLHKTVKTVAGSRPIDIETNDFVIRASKKNKQFVILVGMQSPALASAPAIAKEAVKLLKKGGAVLVEKEKFQPKYAPII